MKLLTIAALCVLSLAVAPAVGRADPAATGQEVYKSHCADCHRTNGEGLAAAFPALKGNPLVQGDPPGVIQVILDGRKGRIGRMPAWKTRLDDAQIAAVITYIRQAWGNAAGPVSPEAVTALRK